MGYTIIIGNAILDTELEPSQKVVRITENADAPVFLSDKATHNTNVRKPKYSEWDAFLHSVGLGELFMNGTTGLMRNHPGIENLEESHYQEINGAYLLFCSPMNAAFECDVKQNSDFVRISWLRFWVRWALDNCDEPAIWNF